MRAISALEGWRIAPTERDLFDAVGAGSIQPPEILAAEPHLPGRATHAAGCVDIAEGLPVERGERADVVAGRRGCRVSSMQPIGIATRPPTRACSPIASTSATTRRPPSGARGGNCAKAVTAAHLAVVTCAFSTASNGDAVIEDSRRGMTRAIVRPVGSGLPSTESKLAMIRRAEQNRPPIGRASSWNTR